MRKLTRIVDPAKIEGIYNEKFVTIRNMPTC